MSKFKEGDLVRRKLDRLNHNHWDTDCHVYGIPTDSVFVVSSATTDKQLFFSGDGEKLGCWGHDNFELATCIDKDKASGVKYDSEKPRVDLLIDGCPLAIEAISQVLTFGAKKYSDHNWQKVEGGEQRYKAAMMRHVLASTKGEKVDSETGLSHLAHAACCVLFMLELELKKDA